MKKNTPGFKETIKQRILFPLRQASSRYRKLPDFLIIGGMKCATTSMYDYLCQHPNIQHAYCKEVHYFDYYFSKNLSWYRSHFPINWSGISRVFDSSLVGESTPYYIFHPHSVKRIASLLPNVKLIVLLRDPVERAYSHYAHEVRLGYEKLSFEEAIRQEKERLDGELERFMRDETYWSRNYAHFSYIKRGLYADQIQLWYEFFPPSQFLILRSEDLACSPQETYAKALDFLGLPNYNLKAFQRKNVRGQEKPRSKGKIVHEKISHNIQTELREFFTPHNLRLEEMTGINWEWSENSLEKVKL